MSDSQEQRSRLDAISTLADVLRQAHEGTATTAGHARNALVLRYRKAIRSYLGAILQNQDDADEVAQNVLVKILKGGFAGADPGKGRFRDYLKMAVRNSALDFRRRKKREVATVSDLPGLLTESETNDKQWLEQWRESLLKLAWDALQEYEQNHHGNLSYTALRLTTDHLGEDSQRLAQRLTELTGRPMQAAAFRKQLSRARKRFAEILVGEVRQSISGATLEDTKEELRQLGLAHYIEHLLADSHAEPSDHVES